MSRQPWPMTSARSKTCSTVAAGRSSASVCRIAFNNRYDLATVGAPVALSRSARQMRTEGGVISSRSAPPNLGRMGSRSGPP